MTSRAACRFDANSTDGIVGRWEKCSGLPILCKQEERMFTRVIRRAELDRYTSPGNAANEPLLEDLVYFVCCLSG